MKIRYSSDVDVLYIRYNDNKIVDSDEFSNGIIEDYDSNGNLVGKEILDASKKEIGQNIISSIIEKSKKENRISTIGRSACFTIPYSLISRFKLKKTNAFSISEKRRKRIKRFKSITKKTELIKCKKIGSAFP